MEDGPVHRRAPHEISRPPPSAAGDSWPRLLAPQDDVDAVGERDARRSCNLQRLTTQLAPGRNAGAPRPRDAGGRRPPIARLQLLLKLTPQGGPKGGLAPGRDRPPRTCPLYNP